MTPQQRLFWHGVMALAKATRETPDQDKEAAADAWALEMEIQARLVADDQVNPIDRVAENPENPEGHNAR